MKSLDKDLQYPGQGFTSKIQNRGKYIKFMFNRTLEEIFSVLEWVFCTNHVSTIEQKLKFLQMQIEGLF